VIWIVLESSATDKGNVSEVLEKKQVFIVICSTQSLKLGQKKLFEGLSRILSNLRELRIELFECGETCELTFFKPEPRASLISQTR
jgi:hypothetical protein